MCGIVAIYAYQPNAAPVDGTELEAIRDHMVPRGPDGAGSWVSENRRIGLAHRRLSIIDLSRAAAQPMAFEEGRYRITYNGEIYNFLEIRQELEAKGHVFRTQSDTEVLLHLYHRYGEKMVEHLRGMYAFALWDEVKRGLLLARDSFGIKPVYYSNTGGIFRAASTVKALKAGGKVGSGDSSAGQVGFFLFGYIPEPHTLFSDIHSLPAGATLWIDENGAREPKKFFDVVAHLSEVPECNAKASPADLRETLLDSIRSHLVADVPVGVFLSSGLDSTTITALAAECHGAGLETVTLGFDEFKGTDKDETLLAEKVAGLYGTNHRTEWVVGSEFYEERDALFAAMDQPTIDGINTYFVSKAAAKSGLKVALSGLGGDEIFGGYDTFSQVPKLARWGGMVPGGQMLGRGFRAISAPLLNHFSRSISPKTAGILELGTRLGDAYLLRRGLFMPWELPQVLDADLVRDGWAKLQPLIRLNATPAAIPEPQRAIAALEMEWYMRCQLLRDADWAGMAHSLEIRVPLVDQVMFKKLAPLIGRTGGHHKKDMARTPATALPHDVLNRSKTGFFVPIRDWLQGEATNVGQNAERGLRGWARDVYSQAAA
jgi:asparagine synthase (glutamine-hydrolysing)